MSDAVTPSRSNGAHRRPMAAVDRRHQILERVAEDQTIRVGELALAFEVSEMTIRRDIARLERDGFVRQTYGGATAHLTRSLDVAFNARALEHTREKRLIGMRATSLLGDARLVYVGIGTTAEQFARFLPARQGLTVVTASLPIASLLGTRSIDVVVLGGAVRQDELTCVGPVAVATLGRYRFDLAVVGAAGLSARWGLTEVDEGDAETQRQAIARAARLMVISDGSKIGIVTNVVVSEAAGVDVLVTDPSAAGGELTSLAGLGIEVAIAGDGVASGAPGVPSHVRT